MCFFRFFLSEKLSYVPVMAWLFSAQVDSKRCMAQVAGGQHPATLFTRKKE
jgi:hypothetical protein